MKKLYITIALALLFYAAFTQNVGIGTNNPQTKLQVDGALSLKTISQTANSSGDISIPEDVSIFRIEPDAFNVAINVTATNPKNGQTLTIYNADGNQATFNGYTIAPTSGVISCVYIDNAWRLVSDNTASGLGGWGTTGNSGTATTSYNDFGPQTNNFIGTTNNQDIEIYTNSSSAKDKTDIRLYTATAPTQTVSAPVDIMHIRRNGQTGVTYPLSASFALGKYNNTVSSETELAVKLAAGNVYVPDVTVMTLRANGNVGIGAIAPDKKLHVGARNGDGILIGNYNDQLDWNGTGTAPEYAIRFAGYRDVVNNFTGAKIAAIRTNLCCSGLSQGTELSFQTQEVNPATGSGDVNLVERLRIGQGGNIIISSLTSGLVKSTAGVLSNATAGTDFENPLTFSSPLNRSGNAVSLGTVGVANGGTGATSLTGVVKGNGSGAFTAMTGISNYVTRWTDANTLSTGVITDNGSSVGVGKVPDAAYSVDIIGSLRVSQSNTTGGGIKLADDGDIVDMNDGFATHRFSYGIRLTNGNSSGTTVVQISNGVAGSGNTYFNSGNNFGINTNGPIQTLDVNGRMNITNGVIQRGGAAITATSDLGLYSRIAGNWMRYVTNGARHAFFTTEGTSGAGSGNPQFAVESDGNLTWNFNGTDAAMLPASFAVIIPHNQNCPAGWISRTVGWDTEDVANTDFGKGGQLAQNCCGNNGIQLKFCMRGAGWGL